jgi:hypothetical protein
VQVGAREQRVVVEHLLEVGDEPLRVDGVTREAAADLVVDAAGCHRAQRPLGDLDVAAPEQELDRRRLRELRRMTEATVGGVERPPEPGDCLVEQRGAHDLLRRLKQRRAL